MHNSEGISVYTWGPTSYITLSRGPKVHPGGWPGLREVTKLLTDLPLTIHLLLLVDLQIYHVQKAGLGGSV